MAGTDFSRTANWWIQLSLCKCILWMYIEQKGSYMILSSALNYIVWKESWYSQQYAPGDIAVLMIVTLYRAVSLYECHELRTCVLPLVYVYDRFYF